MQKHLLALYLPLVISNVLHMFVVKYDIAKPLKITLSSSLFGENKTLRGLIFVSVVNGTLLFMISTFFNLTTPINSFLFGFIIGFTYILFELPNSFIKRRLGIAPGEKSTEHRNLFIILDRCDSALGVSLVYSILLSLSLFNFLILFGFAFFLHFFFSILLFKTGIKENL